MRGQRIGLADAGPEHLQVLVLVEHTEQTELDVPDERVQNVQVRLAVLVFPEEVEVLHESAEEVHGW